MMEPRRRDADGLTEDLQRNRQAYLNELRTRLAGWSDQVRALRREAAERVPDVREDVEVQLDRVRDTIEAMTRTTQGLVRRPSEIWRTERERLDAAARDVHLHLHAVTERLAGTPRAWGEPIRPRSADPEPDGPRHVVPVGDGWAVRYAGSGRTLFEAETKERAVERALADAQEERGHVVIHRADGTIEAHRSFR